MRLKKEFEDIELPEKKSPTEYINVRSAVRVDVRPGEKLLVKTGVLIHVTKNEMVVVHSNLCSSTWQPPRGSYKPLVVPVRNTGERNIVIYPGKVIGSLEVTPPPRRKRVEVKSTVTRVYDDDTAAG